MLQKINQRIQGMVTWAIVLVVASAFAFWGLSDYFTISSDRALAAKVNGKKISWQAVDTIFERMQKQIGDRSDIKAVREQLRHALVQRTALLDSAKNLGFLVSDLQVAEILLKFPVFQEDGKFSKEKYLQVLGDASYSDHNFRQELGQDILLAQLEQGLAQSSFSLRPELVRLVELLNQRRDIGYAEIPIQKFKSGIQITKEEIQAHYDGHQTSFVVPEQVALEYVELSVDDLAKKTALLDDEIKAYYEENKASYSAPERVHARHILIAAPKNVDAKSDEKAKQEAEAILAKLKRGEDFQTLAKETSADTESAKKGGDLGWFVKGQMVPEFEIAAFSLRQPKSLAGPVRSPYGYHIIQLVEHKSAETRPLAEVRELVKEQLQREKAQLVFVEKGEQMAKLGFEQASSLKPIVDALSLKIKETPLFARNAGKDKLTQHPMVQQVAFSDEIINQGNNSEPLKIDDNTLIILRLKKHSPAKQQTQAEVDKQIVEHLTHEKAQAKAKELADTFVKRLKSSENASIIAKEMGLNWIVKTGISRNSTDPSRDIVMAAFQIPHPESATKPSTKIVVLPKDFLVVALSKVDEGDISKLDDETRQSYRHSLTEFLGQLEFSLYANRVLSQAKIEMSNAAPNS